jgi:hypothetical protein
VQTPRENTQDCEAHPGKAADIFDDASSSSPEEVIVLVLEALGVADLNTTAGMSSSNKAPLETLALGSVVEPGTPLQPVALAAVPQAGISTAYSLASAGKADEAKSILVSTVDSDIDDDNTFDLFGTYSTPNTTDSGKPMRSTASPPALRDGSTSVAKSPSDE